MYEILDCNLDRNLINYVFFISAITYRASVLAMHLSALLISQSTQTSSVSSGNFALMLLSDKKIMVSFLNSYITDEEMQRLKDLDNGTLVEHAQGNFAGSISHSQVL